LRKHSRKQSHELRAPNRRTHIEPGAISLDFHIEIAAKVRVPALNRRDSALFRRRTTLRIRMGARNQGFQPAGSFRGAHRTLRRVFAFRGAFYHPTRLFLLECV
jgi:hypothetical protein